MLKNKTIAVCVSGGIAAYKACEVVSRLVKLNASVFVVMTANAKEFVSPLTFETLSNNKVISEMFHTDREWEAEHISLAKRADLFLLCPATANVIGKLANGIADDFLSTTVMAALCPVIVAPAMNTAMLNSPAYINNEKALRKRGFSFVESATGRLACGDVGRGRLAEVDDIVEAVKTALMPKCDFLNKRVLITLGSTREYIDPVRYIGNESSGKMGCALIDAFLSRGAKVDAVCGFVSQNPTNNCHIKRVESAQEMLDCVLECMQENEYDYMVFVAAVCDYRVEGYAKSKLKAQELSLKLIKNPDIAHLATAKKLSKTRVVVFSAETEDLESNAIKKMKAKGADMVVANNVTLFGAGFNADTNIAFIATKQTRQQLDIMKKSDLAHVILDKIVEL